jgi:hypothetical protein
MKKLLVILAVLALTTAALAEKPVIESTSQPATRVSCGLTDIVYDWNFAESDHGFTTMMCDSEGEPVWAYGEDTEYGTVWGTVLNGEYVSDAGEALVSPTFTVDATTQFVEVVHFYALENNFDGCNLEVNGQVVAPIDGYDTEAISTSDNFYAWCVDLEPGFTDDLNDDFVTSCFDLSAFMGEEVALEFTFGSDSSVTYPGWYLASVQVGTSTVPVESKTFSDVKSLYE